MKKLQKKWFNLFFTVKQETKSFNSKNMELSLNIIPKTNNPLLLGIYLIGDKFLSYGRA